MADRDTCSVCGKPEKQTLPVNVVLILNEGRKPYRLLPDEDYVLCANQGCASVVRFIARAIDSHAAARTVIGANWKRVRLVFDDGDGWMITNTDHRPAARC